MRREPSTVNRQLKLYLAPYIATTVGPESGRSGEPSARGSGEGNGECERGKSLDLYVVGLWVSIGRPDGFDELPTAVK